MAVETDDAFEFCAPRHFDFSKLVLQQQQGGISHTLGIHTSSSPPSSAHHHHHHKNNITHGVSSPDANTNNTNIFSATTAAPTKGLSLGSLGLRNSMVGSHRVVGPQQDSLLLRVSNEADTGTKMSASLGMTHPEDSDGTGRASPFSSSADGMTTVMMMVPTYEDEYDEEWFHTVHPLHENPHLEHCKEGAMGKPFLDPKEWGEPQVKALVESSFDEYLNAYWANINRIDSNSSPSSEGKHVLSNFHDEEDNDLDQNDQIENLNPNISTPHQLRSSKSVGSLIKRIHQYTTPAKTPLCGSGDSAMLSHRKNFVITPFSKSAKKPIAHNIILNASVTNSTSLYSNVKQGLSCSALRVAKLQHDLLSTTNQPSDGSDGLTHNNYANDTKRFLNFDCNDDHPGPVRLSSFQTLMRSNSLSPSGESYIDVTNYKEHDYKTDITTAMTEEVHLTSLASPSVQLSEGSHIASSSSNLTKSTAHHPHHDHHLASFIEEPDSHSFQEEEDGGADDNNETSLNRHSPSFRRGTLAGGGCRRVERQDHHHHHHHPSLLSDTVVISKEPLLGQKKAMMEMSTRAAVAPTRQFDNKEAPSRPKSVHRVQNNNLNEKKLEDIMREHNKRVEALKKLKRSKSLAPVPSQQYQQQHKTITAEINNNDNNTQVRAGLGGVAREPFANGSSGVVTESHPQIDSINPNVLPRKVHYQSSESRVVKNQSHTEAFEAQTQDQSEDILQGQGSCDDDKSEEFLDGPEAVQGNDANHVDLEEKENSTLKEDPEEILQALLKDHNKKVLESKREALLAKLSERKKQKQQEKAERQELHKRTFKAQVPSSSMNKTQGTTSLTPAALPVNRKGTTAATSHSIQPSQISIAQTNSKPFSQRPNYLRPQLSKVEVAAASSVLGKVKNERREPVTKAVARGGVNAVKQSEKTSIAKRREEEELAKLLEKHNNKVRSLRVKEGIL